MTTRSRRRHGRAWEPAKAWSKGEGCEQLHPVQTSILSSSSFFFLLLFILLLLQLQIYHKILTKPTHQKKKHKKERDTETEQEISKNREIYHMNMRNTIWVFFHFCVLGCNSQKEKGRWRRSLSVFSNGREKRREEKGKVNTH